MASHQLSPHLVKKAKKRAKSDELTPRAACTLYTYPASTDTVPVYEDITLTWDTSCLVMNDATIDLYLNVEEAAGLTAVHEWTGIEYSKGSLATQFNPGWWNASTGAGTVSGQLIMTPHGSQIWDTNAPSGPLFSVTYNGTHPATVTASAESPTYTGPSVESVSDPSTSSTISGGKLGAAVAIPVIAVIACVGAYIAWNKLRKRPEKKRWSAVIDNRMSMISQGTWQPPRPSTSSRPGSHYQHSRAGSLAGSVRPPGSPGHRPAASINSQARHSLFVDARPNSAYSQLSGAPSPLSAGSIRPPPSAEMRQIGQGQRASAISFSGDTSPGRPSFSSSRHHPGPSSLRNPTVGTDARSSYYAASQHSPGLSLSSPAPGLPRNGSTREELALAASASSASLPKSPSSASSMNFLLAAPPSPVHVRTRKTSNLSTSTATVRDSVVLASELADFPAIAVMRDGDLAYSSTSPSPSILAASPVDSPEASPHKLRAQKRQSQNPGFQPTSHMPVANQSLVMSPDELLRHYAMSPELLQQHRAKAEGAKGKGGNGKAGKFLGAPKRFLRGFGGGGKSGGSGDEAEKEVMGEKSPFADDRGSSLDSVATVASGSGSGSGGAGLRVGGTDADDLFRKSTMTVGSQYSSDGGKASSEAEPTYGEAV